MNSWPRIENVFLTICGISIIIPGVLAETTYADSSGTWANISLGFGLVIFGATLSTLGSMILFLDAPLRLLPWFSVDFSLATSKPFLASSLSFSTGVLTTTIFINLIPEGIKSFECSNMFGKHSDLAAGVYFSICTLLVLSGKLVSIRYKLWKETRNKSALKGEDLRIPLPEILSNRDLQCLPTQEAHTDFSPEAVSLRSFQLEETRKKFEKLGYQVAVAIALHNFPEGGCTFCFCLSIT
ncbi:hypothetical protein DSO57_1009498 [Entomophthora muscae]|uniref:Uncharacterized protein n=1 Tax=Entomophthora muscae TaxID=34485 RepID=A0ACC2UTR9_9FUNG|nr:hypothetical protein DSO57_1009498 [Entomophthora muscae]